MVMDNHRKLKRSIFWLIQLKSPIAFLKKKKKVSIIKMVALKG